MVFTYEKLPAVTSQRSLAKLLSKQAAFVTCRAPVSLAFMMDDVHFLRRRECTAFSCESFSSTKRSWEEFCGDGGVNSLTAAPYSSTCRSPDTVMLCGRGETNPDPPTHTASARSSIPKDVDDATTSISEVGLITK
jgi:hypothetical protein